MSVPARSRPPGCVSDLVFDAWFAGELAMELESPMQAHVARCLRCRTRRGALAADRAAFLATRPNYVASTQRLAWRYRRTLITLGALTGTAILTFLLFTEDSDSEALPPAAAANQLSFSIERGEHVERGRRGQDVRPSDVVHFEYSSQGAAYIAIYGLDSHGAVRVYYPQSEVSSPVGAGDRIPIGAARHHDGVVGVEQLFALFCEAPFTVAEYERTLELQGALAPSPGCDVTVTDWNKTR